MKYYFFDTSGFLWCFRREQHTDEKGNLFGNILDKITGGNPTAGYNNFIASDLLSYEMIKVLISKSQTPETFLNITKFLVEFNSFIKVGVNKDVLEKSIKLMEKYGLKSFDAIQLACALKAKNIYKELIFISYDKALNKAARSEGLDVNIT